MCRIADPTEKGVWWKNDTNWELYSPENARKILRAKKNGDMNITLGSVKSAKYPSGKLYAIDLVAMKQTNLNTGFSREIKIINPGPTDDQEDVESDEEDEIPTFYRPTKAELINLSGDSGNIVKMVPSVTVDLGKLTSQCHLEDECNLVLKLPRVSSAQSDLINSLSKKTLELLLEKFTSKDFIKNIVRHKMQSRGSELVWKVCPRQPYVVGRMDNPGMYGSFLAELCKMAEDDHLFVDDLFRIAREGTTKEGDNVEYLFKNVVPTTENTTPLPCRYARVPPLPSEGGRISVCLAILQFVQGKRDLPVIKGSALHLAELVSVGNFGYS